jgi:2-methylcitrate dehydratase PrpD
LLLNNLGSEFAGDGLSFKPYPCGRPLHAGIDAALAARAQLGVTNSAQIDQVQIAMDQTGYGDQFESGASKRRPTQVVEAQFALPFLVATALVHGRVGIADVAGLGDAATLALADRITGEVVTGRKPRGWVVLTLRLTDGRTARVESSDPIGSPQKPLSAALLRAKFQDNAANAVRQIAEANVTTALEMLERLDSIENVYALSRMFA